MLIYIFNTRIVVYIARNEIRWPARIQLSPHDNFELKVSRVGFGSPWQGASPVVIGEEVEL